MLNFLEQGNILVANVDDVDRVIVPGEVRKVVVKVGALPRLGDGPVKKGVALVRPHILHKAHSVILIVMEDGVCERVSETSPGEQGGLGVEHTQWLLALDFNLAIGPSRDFHHHVDDLVVLLVGVYRDIVPERDGLPVTQKPEPPVLDPVRESTPSNSSWPDVTYEGISGADLPVLKSRIVRERRGVVAVAPRVTAALGQRPVREEKSRNVCGELHRAGRSRCRAFTKAAGNYQIG